LQVNSALRWICSVFVSLEQILTRGSILGIFNLNQDSPFPLKKKKKKKKKPACHEESLKILFRPRGTTKVQVNLAKKKQLANRLKSEPFLDDEFNRITSFIPKATFGEQKRESGRACVRPIFEPAGASRNV